MLQMVRTLAQFTIALEEMQENGESASDDGGAGDEPQDRGAAEANGNPATAGQVERAVRVSFRRLSPSLFPQPSSPSSFPGKALCLGCSVEGPNLTGSIEKDCVYMRRPGVNGERPATMSAMVNCVVSTVVNKQMECD